MNTKNQLKEAFEKLEEETVGDSFGGEPVDGKAPVFKFKPIMDWLRDNIEQCDDGIKDGLSALSETLEEKEFSYLLSCLGRFCFCIELTNLKITSTKMKTRWVPGSIIKTMEGGFQNYRGSFSPGEDERSSEFGECYEILRTCISILSQSPQHIELLKKFSDQRRRGISYESVFTYIDNKRNPVHVSDNIRLVSLDNAMWLAEARPIIYPILNYDLNENKTKCVSKIQTKSYKTDRSQTGEVQTNRAKRWECVSIDFQHASIEECWSVERKLLSDVAHFMGFPEEPKKKLIESGLFHSQELTLCPITLKPMQFEELLGGGGHGESQFQVGHMKPLKSGGRHNGENISWISSDGNRIQGNLSIEDTRQMLEGIFSRMGEHNLL